MLNIKPVRIQRKRARGFNLQAASMARNGLPCVYVGRPTKWGNPFDFRTLGRDEALRRFDLYIRCLGYDYRKAPNPAELKGKNLACFCAENESCHADILLSLANDDPKLRKRTYVYCQMPQVYGISGCPKNARHKFTWSEFEHRLWCYECETEFIPRSWGIFDGPIPWGLALEMGIRFDRINIKTRKLVKCPDLNDEKAMAGYNRTWNDRPSSGKSSNATTPPKTRGATGQESDSNRDDRG